MPDEYCEGDYMGDFGMIAYPGLLIYAVIIPVLLLRSACKKSHTIFRSGGGELPEKKKEEVEDEKASKEGKEEKDGKDSELTTEEREKKEKEEAEKAVAEALLAAELDEAARCKFGFLYSGLTTGRTVLMLPSTASEGKTTKGDTQGEKMKNAEAVEGAPEGLEPVDDAEKAEKEAEDAKRKKWWRVCLRLTCREALSGDGVAL